MVLPSFGCTSTGDGPPQNLNLEEAFISVLLRSDLEDELEDCETRREILQGQKLVGQDNFCAVN